MSTRRFLLAIAFALLAVVTGGQPSRASDPNHAGVVIRQPDGSLTYAYVAFDDESLSGIELLRRTGVEVSTVSFGGLGEGVCSIDESGCVPSECRKRVCQGPKHDDPFWQFFQETAPGEWTAFALGASSTQVRDGEIVGWSWTGTTPQLPSITLDEIASRAGAGGIAAEGVYLTRTGSTGAATSSTSTWLYVAAASLFGIAVVAAGIVIRAKRASPS